MFYNARFGRKKETEEESREVRPENNGSYSNGSGHANGGPKNPHELAVFEQFDRQVRFELNFNREICNCFSV